MSSHFPKTTVFLDSPDKTGITRDCLHVRRTSNGAPSVRQHAAAILDSVATPSAEVPCRNEQQL